MKTKNLKSDSRLKTLLSSFSEIIIKKTGIEQERDRRNMVISSYKDNNEMERLLMML